MLKGKVWGTTETVLATPQCELHRIEVRAGAHCSWHHHERKWNGFSIVTGGLRIETIGSAGVETLDLAPGEFTSIAPGVEHRFVNISGETARGLELYYLEGLGGEDIVRSSQGGRQ